MTNNTVKLSVTEQDVGCRLDIFLAKKINSLTRSNLKKIIEAKQVLINKNIIYSPSYKIRIDEIIFVSLDQKIEQDLIPSNIKLNIIYEDASILIINKPSGMVVHPGAGNFKNTLVNALIFKYKKKLSDLNGELRPGIVHRIDKETSGLIVVAKNNISHSNLGRQFNEHTIKRKYLALVWGVIRPLEGRIETLIARNKKNRQLMAVSEVNGKKAITNYKTLKVFDIKNVPRISLIECKLETGRTHQIRVHMAYKKNQILGDKQYGKKNIKFKKIDKDFETKLSLLNRQALHAKSLGFVHPENKENMNFESDLPDDFKKLLNLLEKLSD
tara:strand:- start:461 stop:1444 length:984 start_codon:yes stop_codon:yes gene_type:complete